MRAKAGGRYTAGEPLSQGGRTRVMQFSALRYFLETARLGSIRRAAEKLYVAPSAVSRQIALLERNFGAPLFERHVAAARPTPAGGGVCPPTTPTLHGLSRPAAGNLYSAKTPA